MTDGLRIAHLGIAPQWAILRWAILRVIVFSVTFLIKLFSFGSTGFLSFLWLKKAAGPNI